MKEKEITGIYVVDMEMVEIVEEFNWTKAKRNERDRERESDREINKNPITIIGLKEQIGKCMSVHLKNSQWRHRNRCEGACKRRIQFSYTFHARTNLNI